MQIVSSTPEVKPAPLLAERHSLAIRIWHWLFFLFILCTIATVVLATFVFNTGKNIPLVQEQLQGKGVTVDAGAARAVSHAYNDKLWELHTWIGYGIAFLFFSRLVLEVFQPGEEKFRGKLRRVMGFVPASSEQARDKQHYIGVKWGYLAFYAVILVVALTGLGLALEDVPFFRSIRRPIKSVHNFSQYLVYSFVIIHIAGVVRAELGHVPGLVSGMINGRRIQNKE